MSNLYFKDGKPYYQNDAEVECKSGKNCVVNVVADVVEVLDACRKHLRDTPEWNIDDYNLARQITYNWTKMSDTAKKLNIDTKRKRLYKDKTAKNRKKKVVNTEVPVTVGK